MNAVTFEDVSKAYPVYDSPQERLLELAGLGRRHRRFTALDGVSFEVGRGEVFCLIGANGSGKSTALQIAAGILAPTSGRVSVEGQVAALLELGSGFNPEFTGRDNVFLNGAVHGLSRREIDSKFDAIAAFAEIGEFIDRPVKTYSSGMTMRLAFAVAISVEPEILIVDEALAVGDAYFRGKCMRRVQELKARGATILFVSHSSADVRAIGDRALWLERGRAMAIGPAEDVLARYLAAAFDEPERAAEAVPGPAEIIEPVRTIPNIDHRHGDGRAEILGIALLSEFGDPLHLMAAGHRTLIRITAQAHSSLARPGLGFLMRNHLGLDFCEITTSQEKPLGPLAAGETVTVDFLLDTPQLYPGAFSFSPFVREEAAEDGGVADWIDNAITVQMSREERPVYGYIQVPCRIEAVSRSVNDIVTTMGENRGVSGIV